MRYGLIGKTLSHSYSKIIHNMLGNNEYELCQVENIDAFMAKKDFDAINVTIPYKQDVMKYCECSFSAMQIGSVNTIVNKDGKLFGYNTDFLGLEYMLKDEDFKGKKILILGSGGTSKTANYISNKKGAQKVIVVSRNGENNYNNLDLHYDSNVIINTTPVGMHPNIDESIIDISKFNNLLCVIDVIYNPLKTMLIMQAKARGIKTYNGLTMLVAQAVFAHNLFFNEDKTDCIDSITKNIQNDISNFVLVGMPGCGKSTIGKKLADLLNKQFIDSDEQIFIKTGKTPNQIINQYGEEHFRQIESEVIKEVSNLRGCVIATGGGSILKFENRKRLAQNGFIIFLDKKLNMLEIKDRPLSKDLEKLYKNRFPLYIDMCDARIEIQNDVEENVKRIVKLL